MAISASVLICFAYLNFSSLPESKLIFPSANEQSDFPFFNEIAMNVGVAHNGLSGGTCVDDFNGDGFLDIFSTSYAMDDSVNLSLNDTKGGFINATYDSGLSGIVSGLNSIHADYDNDGYKDLFVSNGYKRDVMNKDYTSKNKDKGVKNPKIFDILQAEIPVSNI